MQCLGTTSKMTEWSQFIFKASYSTCNSGLCPQPFILWLTHWKRPRCWKRLRAGGEGDNRGWDVWMESPTWTWVRASSGSWWWQGSMVCCSPWGRKESDTTERLNWCPYHWCQRSWSWTVLWRPRRPPRTNSKKRCYSSLGTGMQK